MKNKILSIPGPGRNQVAWTRSAFSFAVRLFPVHPPGSSVCEWNSACLWTTMLYCNSHYRHYRHHMLECHSEAGTDLLYCTRVKFVEGDAIFLHLLGAPFDNALKFRFDAVNPEIICIPLHQLLQKSYRGILLPASWSCMTAFSGFKESEVDELVLQQTLFTGQNGSNVNSLLKIGSIWSVSSPTKGIVVPWFSNRLWVCAIVCRLLAIGQYLRFDACSCDWLHCHCEFLLLYWYIIPSDFWGEIIRRRYQKMDDFLHIHIQPC